MNMNLSKQEIEYLIFKQQIEDNETALLLDRMGMTDLNKYFEPKKTLGQD